MHGPTVSEVARHRMRRVSVRVLASFFALVLSGVTGYVIDARADGPVHVPFERLEHLGLRVKETEEAIEKTIVSKSLGLKFYGYLEGSYTQNFNNPSNRINQLRIFDVNSNEFRPNLAQLVLEREAKSDGSGLDRLGGKVKFNAGRDSDFIGGMNLSDWADFQEVYAQYIVPVGAGLDIKLGQVNSLVGYEVVESPYNANYSRSWLFGLGQPFTTRGVRGTYAFDKHVSLSVGVIAFINSARANTRYDPLTEAALTISPSDRVTLVLYNLLGQRPGAVGTPGGMLVQVGGYLSLHLTDRASAIIESYYANQANSSTISPAGNARWNGVAGYLIYDMTKEWGIRVRSELYEDAGGFTTCEGTTAYQPRANVCFGATSTTSAPPVGQTLWEVTTTLQYKPFKSLTTRLEYRYDKSNQHVFQIGERAATYQPTLSLDVIYLF